MKTKLILWKYPIKMDTSSPMTAQDYDFRHILIMFASYYKNCIL